MKKLFQLSFWVFLMIVVCMRSFAQTGYITTIAGNGVTQYIGDGWPATNYSLAMPSGICIDKDGNVFNTDFISQRVRRTNSYDSIFTYAGIGSMGYSGNNGPATMAALHNPYGIALDTSGNLYISEQYNDVIRKIDKVTGIITTICGSGSGGFSGDNGPATAAHLESPSGICIDRAGNIYIADKGNSRIRKVDINTGIITTVAGSAISGYSGDNGPATIAKLAYPTGVCVDSIGNIYIADNGNNCIRKVTADGTISTFAGNGLPGYTGDGGQATNAALTHPSHIHISGRGNLYIADYGNNVVRIIGSGGVIETIAGSGGFGYTGDNGPATAARFVNPMAVCTDANENIYIADFGNSAIRRVQAAPVGIINPATAALQLYPNPTEGLISIPVRDITFPASIAVCNITGVVVVSKEVHSPGNTQLDLACLPAGTYFVQLLSGNAIRMAKVVRL